MISSCGIVQLVAAGSYLLEHLAVILHHVLLPDASLFGLGGHLNHHPVVYYLYQVVSQLNFRGQHYPAAALLQKLRKAKSVLGGVVQQSQLLSGNDLEDLLLDLSQALPNELEGFFHPLSLGVAGQPILHLIHIVLLCLYVIEDPRTVRQQQVVPSVG